MNAPLPGTKYIIGWITLREGREAEFDRIAEPYKVICRAEKECRFFEMIRSREAPLTVFVCESFDSEDAHTVHKGRQHMQDFWAELHRLAEVATFENVISRKIDPDTADFRAE